MNKIDTIESLREHLQGAMKLEHATIPTYLTALFSIKDGYNQVAAQVIKGVVMEEMLHMTLVGNVLNAVGGTPVINSAKFVPAFPGHLPYSDNSFEIGLLKFSPEALNVFLRIEKPEAPNAAPEPDRFHTIGQFYQALINAVKSLEMVASKNGKTIFTGKPVNQIQPQHFYYGGGGGVIAVSGLNSAVAALEEVIEQGEGRDHTIYDGDEHGFGQNAELAHYYRFNELYKGRYYAKKDTPADTPSGSLIPIDWSGVWNMAPNPKVARYESRSDVVELMQNFNREYANLLKQMDRAFNGDPDKMLESVPIMYRLKYQATGLMKIPSGSGETTIGPSWEYPKN